MQELRRYDLQTLEPRMVESRRGLMHCQSDKSDGGNPHLPDMMFKLDVLMFKSCNTDQSADSSAGSWDLAKAGLLDDGQTASTRSDNVSMNRSKNCSSPRRGYSVSCTWLAWTPNNFSLSHPREESCLGQSLFWCVSIVSSSNICNAYAFRLSRDRKTTNLIYGWLKFEEPTHMTGWAQCSEALHDLLDHVPVFSFPKSFHAVVFLHSAEFNRSALNTQLFKIWVAFIVKASKEDYPSGILQNASELNLFFGNQ